MRWPWRRKPYPPREGWLVLTDVEGRPVSEHIAVVVNGDPLEFTVEHALTPSQLEVVRHVRVTDADGNVVEVPL